MAILTVESKNEFMSWVIFKNPNTQQETGVPFERALRKGIIYGWYSDSNQFRLWFDQNQGEPSFYKNENNNYLNADKVLCSYAYCGIITNMLDATIKKVHEKDIICENKVTINTILIPNVHMANSFKKHLKAINITIEQLGGKLYTVTFEGNTTLYYLLNAVMVFCLMQALEDRRVFVDLTEPAIAKYAQCLKAIEAPYYIIYMFLSRCVPDYNLFKKVSESLTKDNWKLHYGDTQKQRFSAIKKYFRNGETLHDIGCGELYYSSALSANYKNVIAWDADEEIIERNKRYIVKKGLNNIELKNAFSIESLKEVQNGSDILITEMLEHISIDQANNLLANLTKVNFSTLVITVPNTTFNKHYLLEGMYRHLDHKWEPTYEESVELINKHFNTHEVKVEKIGDMVDVESVSTLFVIRKKNQ
jgi:ubiquinone/menaquinone biosynthesis C-methylase UbiE